MSFKPYQPLDESITGILEGMLSDLKKNRLSVRLIPAPEPKFIGHMIRVRTGENPDWYSHIYHACSRPVRSRVERVLGRMISERKIYFSDLEMELLQTAEDIEYELYGE